MTYLLENSAAQVQQMHYKTTQLPTCFCVNSEEFSTCHDKMDLASSNFCREYWAQRETKLSELMQLFVDSALIYRTCSLG